MQLGLQEHQSAPTALCAADSFLPWPVGPAGLGGEGREGRGGTQDRLYLGGRIKGGQAYEGSTCLGTSVPADAAAGEMLCAMGAAG